MLERGEKTYIFLNTKFLKKICALDMHLKHANTQRFASVIYIYT